jgi:hypothetical protein
LEANVPQTAAVYLFHETGMAPYRKEVAFSLPIYAGGTFSWVSVAIPYLESDANYTPFATVQGGGQRATAELVCDLDAVVSQEYRNDYSGHLTRAIASATAKAAVTYAMNAAAKQSGDAITQLVALIGTAAYQIGTTVADTRSWISLPKQIGVSRIDLPADRLVSVSCGGQTLPVVLPKEGEIFVLYLRTMHLGGKAHLRVMTIR